MIDQVRKGMTLKKKCGNACICTLMMCICIFYCELGDLGRTHRWRMIPVKPSVVVVLARMPTVSSDAIAVK